MSIEIGEPVQKRIETVVSEQFDAFERQDHEIRMEGRRERALRLPIAVQVNLIGDSSGQV